MEHNYFHGLFNETLSFKEGDWDPDAGYNTFEGSALTALFFGQNLPQRAGPLHEAAGRQRARGAGRQSTTSSARSTACATGQNVVYYLRSPIRVWHVNGDTTLRGNVVEQAQQGVLLECRAGSQAGCDTGTTRLTGNTIAGQVRDLSALSAR